MKFNKNTGCCRPLQFCSLRSQKIGLQQPHKDEELKRQKRNYWDLWQATPFITTRQTTT